MRETLVASRYWIQVPKWFRTVNPPARNTAACTLKGRQSRPDGELTRPDQPSPETTRWQHDRREAIISILGGHARMHVYPAIEIAMPDASALPEALRV